MYDSITEHDVMEDYPKVFLNGRPRCGMAVGKGWSTIIEGLLERIENLLPEKHEFKVAQVKEKFGGLRFCYEGRGIPKETREKIDKLVAFAENLSFMTCEICGKSGARDSGGSRGWIKTLCGEHAEERSRIE
jgi:hypothetical protein